MNSPKPVFKHTARILVAVVLVGCTAFVANCNKGDDKEPTPPPTQGTVEQWITKNDQSALLQKQSSLLAFTTTANGNGSIDVNESTTFQSIEGFGYTLTGGSAHLLNGMSAAERAKVLQELFGNGDNSIGISYLRLSLGASDLSTDVFSYCDLPAGQTDPGLTKFSLAADTLHLIPVLKEILAINPNIKLMASPWSAPTWMKTNGSSIGGSLLPAFYASYAQYFVKYVQAMKAKGISIDAVTVQNEPQHGGNNPSMLMTAAEQTDFVKNHLGPAFRSAGIATKIIVWDHNCDNPNYPISILNDAAAKQFVAGSAFHLYAGDITALSTVRAAHPDKDLYFTEQWTGSKGSFEGDFAWHTRNVIIGSMNNWARVALEWNLANDPFYGPHTPGGCTECKGALTINGGAYNRNVSYYIIAQVSKFVPPGSVRIACSSSGNLPATAFKTPAGKKVLLVQNETGGAVTFNIKHDGKWAVAQMPAGSTATYVW